MNSRKSIYRVLSFVTVLSMVSGLAPPAAAASTSQAAAPDSLETMPIAPSELDGDWPTPELPAHEPSSPFLDPISLALEKAQRGVADAESLSGGDLVRLEPLTPYPSPSVGLPGIDSELFDSGAQLRPVPPMPNSLPSANLPIPFASLPTPPDPTAEASPALPQPHDLAAFADHDESIEETLDLDGAEEDATDSERVAAASTDDENPEGLEDIPTAVDSGLASSDPTQPISEVANPVESLAQSAVVSETETLQEEVTGQDGDTTIYLPLVVKGGDASTSVEITVTPEEGGTLISSDGRVLLDVPSGAVSSKTMIRYSQLLTQTVEGFQSTGDFFELTAKDESGSVVTQFNQDLTLRVQYNEVAGLDEAKLQLYYLDEVQLVWVPISSTIDVDNNNLIATVDHFTPFGPLIPMDNGVQLISVEGGPMLTVFAMGGAQLHLRNFDSGATFVAEPNPDDGLFYVGPMAVGSRVGFHFTDPNGNVLPFSGYDLSMPYSYWAYNEIGFQPLFVGQKAPSWEEFDAFLAAYHRNGGKDQVGPADTELVHDWEGSPTQGFLGGNGHPSSVIIYNSGRCAAFQVKGSIFDVYANTGGPGGWLGRPIDDELTVPPEFYEHPIGQPIGYFEHGIIAQKPDGSYAAENYYPFIGDIYVEFNEVEPDLFQPRFQASVLPVPGFPDAQDEVTVSGRYVVGNGVVTGTLKYIQLENQGNNVFAATINDTLSKGQLVSFRLAVERTADGRKGHAPKEEGTIVVEVVAGTHGPFQLLEPDPSISDCSGGGYQPSRDTVPPVIHYVDIFQDGLGGVLVEANVTDNYAVGTVELIFNGDTYEMAQTGDDIYGYAISDGPTSGENSYRIHAIDTAGNEAWFPKNKSLSNPASHAGHFGADAYCYAGNCGDPVNTQNGNFTYETTDVVVAGVGDTDLIIKRAYNSLAAFGSGGGIVRYTEETEDVIEEEIIAGPPQYFGRAWTFPYAVTLVAVDNLLMSGAQVFYPDGRAVNFENNGDGTFSPTTPFSFDVLVATANGYELRRKRTLEVEIFDAEGRLIAREDRNGNRITLSYDDNRLSRVENDSGRWLNFDYDDEGHIVAIHAPEGKMLRYEYQDGNLIQYTNARGHDTRYSYNVDNQLTQITTPKTHPSVRLDYDDQWRVIQQIIGEAERYGLDYSEDGTLTTQTDAYGRITQHYYDKEGRLIQSEDALGFSEYYDYDENFNRTYYRDQEDREWHWTYDDRGNRLTEDGPLGWHREWEYNDLDRVIRMQDALGQESFFDYDDKGNLTTITNALDVTSTITYDERGLPTHIFDFNGNETVNTYDPVTGDLIQTRNGAGDEVGFSYDGLGRMRTMTNGRGFLYTYTYDGNDNLTAVDGPLGYHLAYEYDANDNLAKEIDPNGGETQYFYDESENLVQVENQLGFPVLYDYDDMNNLIRVEDAEGRVWTYAYDAVYNRVAEHGPEDTHTFFAYDGVGNLTDVTRCNSPLSGDTCPVKQVTHYEYDDLDRVVEMIENYMHGEPKSADTNVTTGYEYDLVGNLLTLTDANDNPTTYEYDDLDRLIYEEDAENQVTEYGYDGMGNLTSLANPRDYETTFTYDGANRLEMTTDALGYTWTYAYDGNGNLTDMTDPLGVVTHNEYDELDRLSSLTLNYLAGAPATVDQNVTTRFEYDLAGNLRFVYDPRGTYQTEHRYDAAHRRVLTTDAEGGETEFGYDKVDNLLSRMDANDHETTYEYDGLDRQVKVTNPEGHSVRFEYDRLGNLRVLTDARGYQTAFTYDGMNRLVLRVDAMAGKWRYEYDAMGNLSRHIDANGHANNTYTYDKVYRLKTSTDAEGYVTSFTYDQNGNMLTLTDGNQHTTSYTYDELDRLASTTNAEDETTHYQYDPLGNQTYLIEADGIVTLYTYDPLYRLTVVTQNYRHDLGENADTNVDIHYGYDEVGNLLTILNAEEHTTHFRYDGLNRLVQEVDALGNTWDYEYDPVGNRTVRIDAKRDRTEYAYYPDDQLQLITYHDGTSVAYTYDENNNRLTMDDHLGTTTWVYDPLNRVTDVTDPFGRHLGYAYDPVDNRIGLTYADGRTVNYTYYDNNWLKTVVDPEGNVTSYQRDGVGQVTKTTNPNSTVSEMVYDKANRLLSLVNYQIEGAFKANSSFAYTYNEVSHRVQMVAEYAWRKPNEIVTSNYTYDGLRRLVRDEDSEGVWTEYTFDRVGNRLTLRSNDSSLSTRPFDELIIFYTYNDINQLLTTVANTHPGSSGLKRAENTAQPLHAFRHEVAAQRGKHITEAAADTLLAMADALLDDLYGSPAPGEAEVASAIQALRDQVMADRASGGIDSNGVENSLLVKLDWSDQANNEWQTTTYLYDANGNRVNKEFPGPQGPRVQGTDYTYDPENRLVVAHDYQMNLQGNRVDRQITRLEYDGGGRRLVKEYDPKDGAGGAKRVEYVFDGLDPVAEYNIWNPQYENFYRGDLGRIITLHHFPSGSQGQMFWFHYNGLGSVSGLTKQEGQSHHNYRYEPYGQIEMPPGNFTDPHNHYTFTGKEWDEHTELYYFGARHYDPIVGVWLTQDVYRGTVERPSNLHRYAYVEGNPINYIDPRGYSGELVRLETTLITREELINIQDEIRAEIEELQKPPDYNDFWGDLGDLAKDSLFTLLGTAGTIGELGWDVWCFRVPENEEFDPFDADQWREVFPSSKDVLLESLNEIDRAISDALRSDSQYFMYQLTYQSDLDGYEGEYLTVVWISNYPYEEPNCYGYASVRGWRLNSADRQALSSTLKNVWNPFHKMEGPFGTDHPEYDHLEQLYQDAVNGPMSEVLPGEPGYVDPYWNIG